MTTTVNLVDRVLAMGRRYQEIGRHRDAAALFARLSRFRHLPAEAAEEAQARLAEIYLKRRKYQRARRHLTAALRHQPDNARYHYLLATALQAEEGSDWQRAGEHYRRALELDPNHAKCRADYGHLLLRLGQTDEGLQCLREAVQSAPQDAEVMSKLVKGLRLAGRGDEARSTLQIALFRNARSPRFRKLWNEFRFQQARRRRETERLRQENEDANAEAPILLPFVRVVADDAVDSTSVRGGQAAVAAPARCFRLVRRSDRRNVL